MDIIIANEVFNCLMISIIVSIIVMAIVQKIKTLECVNKDCHILAVNLILSFMIGITFSLTFYDISIVNAIWVGVFSFVGAPSLYKAFKNINMKSLDDYVNKSEEDNNKEE